MTCYYFIRKTICWIPVYDNDIIILYVLSADQVIIPGPQGTMKTQPVRNLNIVGDFIKYTIILFMPFFIIGAIYGLIYRCYFTCILLNPLIYSTGISLIIIVIMYDVNDILGLVGLAKEHQLSYHIKHANAIQEIGLLMSTPDYDNALHKVRDLVIKEPKFTNALNMKGEILLEGFQQYEDARRCFKKVLKLSKPDNDQYKLAEALMAASYTAEER